MTKFFAGSLGYYSMRGSAISDNFVKFVFTAVEPVSVTLKKNMFRNVVQITAYLWIKKKVSSNSIILNGIIK